MRAFLFALVCGRHGNGVGGFRIFWDFWELCGGVSDGEKFLNFWEI